MRRYLSAVVVAAAALVMAAGSAWTEEPEKPAGPQRRHGHHARRHGRMRQHMLDRLAEKLDLSADEKAAVGDVLADHHKAVEAYRDEHRDEFVALRKKMRQAHKDGDRDELQALRKKMREMISGRMELAKSLHKQVLAALPEDKAAEAKAMFAKARKRHAAVRHRFMQRHPGLRMLAGLRKLDLSDEQREKIRDIVADAQEKIEDVLTDEQKEKLKQMRRRAAAERRGGRSRRDRPASDGKD